MVRYPVFVADRDVDHMTSTVPHPDRRLRGDRPFVGRGLRDAWAHFNAELLAGLQDHYPAATVAMNQVMILIDAQGSTLAELARRAGITKQAMAESVAHLEAIGLVRRAPHPGDRRAKLVQLTEEGWTALRAGFTVATAIERRWTTLLGPEAMNDLTRILDELVDVLDNTAHPAP